MDPRVVADKTGPPASVRRLGHSRALDGLRGCSFSAVFLAHAGLVPFAGLGASAMFVFFALSGFLIAALLFGERARSGRVRLRRFFARRALRLVPALVLLLACWLVVVAVFGRAPWITTVPGGGKGAPEPFGVALQGVGYALSYLTNWATVFHGYGGYVPLGHLWSLAVEEQFYLVFAPLLALALRRTRLAIVLAGVVVVATLCEVAWLKASGRGLWAYMGTDARAGAFLAGAAVALAWSSGGLGRLLGRWGGLVGAAAVVALLWCAPVLAGARTTEGAVLAWGVATLGAALLVGAVVGRPQSRLAAMLSNRVLVYLGKRSYGLYLWHYLWLTWLRSLGLAGVALAVVCSLACAEASWRLVEAPALRLKRHVASPEHAAPEQSTSVPTRELVALG